jgi:hypothetical protein
MYMYSVNDLGPKDTSALLSSIPVCIHVDVHHQCICMHADAMALSVSRVSQSSLKAASALLKKCKSTVLACNHVPMHCQCHKQTTAHRGLLYGIVCAVCAELIQAVQTLTHSSAAVIIKERICVQYCRRRYTTNMLLACIIMTLCSIAEQSLHSPYMSTSSSMRGAT